MNSGVLVLLIIVGTIGAGIVVTVYRDLIFTSGSSSRPRDSSWTTRRPPVRRSPVRAAETKSKPAEAVSSVVSGAAMPDNDPEMVSFRVLAKLINAKLITETAALETTFDVAAGSSKAYKAAQAKLKKAQAELESLTRSS